MSSNALASDEKLFAALAHGSVVFSFFGPIGPIIVWLLQRDKSKYASFSALQAMGFQVISFWLWMLLIFLFPIALVLLILLMVFVSEGAENFGMFPFALQIVMFIAIFGVWGIYMLIGFIGAGFSIAGKEFRYPLLGAWLA